MELEIEEPILWIDKLFKKIVSNNNIPIPVSIINKTHNLDIAIDIFEHIRSNWYYDFINPNHLGSLSIRMANLSRFTITYMNFQDMKKNLHLCKVRQISYNNSFTDLLKEDK